ncbi:hypothetical protein NC652_021129 [Populus alba x Populus x berolinensis]|nr:hypothetical protein NC652_021129 [Populus alba x Populus x berolinensis]
MLTSFRPSDLGSFTSISQTFCRRIPFILNLHAVPIVSTTGPTFQNLNQISNSFNKEI